MKRWLAVLFGVTAAWALAPPAELPSAVRGSLDAVCGSSKLGGGSAGLLVMALGERQGDADSFALAPYVPGQRPELYARAADQAFTPASNMKLLTTAAALDVLGEDYRFTTTVRASSATGEVPALWLVGGGDPSLDAAGLRSLAQSVKAAGITHVKGPVGCDGTRYHDKWAAGWTEDDRIWYYGAEVWGIALGRNQVDVTVRPGGVVGRAARIEISPTSSYIKVRNGVTTAGAAAASDLDWDHDVARRALVISGKVPNQTGAAWSQGLAVPDVPLYAATVFRDLLREAGVKVDGEPQAGPAPAGLATVAKLDSAPLGTVIVRLMKRSDNLYAEMLNRELGYKVSGDGGAVAGAAVVSDFLKRRGIATDRLRLVDGSGLARTTLVTPRALVGVLTTMADHRCRAAWWASLPIAGRDGTLANRMKGSAAEANCRAKTGTLTGRTSLSGYVADRNGDLLAVASIFNGFDCGSSEARGLHDRIFEALAAWRR